ncbi:MAG: response regulator [Chloroflexi bacterium]|nr:response regulator [Chloroflexota bacterium]
MPEPKRSTILIIDQDEPTRILYQRELNRFYDVFISSDQESAANALEETPLAAVVLDPGMPDCWVWDYIALIRQRSAIPIVVCTSQDDRRRALALGATVYLLKPVLPCTLLAELTRLIQVVE